MSEEPVKVLSLVADVGNQRLLTDWLADQQGYSVVKRSGPVESTAFELCVVDSGGLREHRDELQRRKAEEAPVILPYLLLVPAGTSDIFESGDDLSEMVDDIATLPVDPVELKFRLESLHRLRRQSLTIKQTKERALRKLRRSVNASSYAIYITDPEGTIEFVNPAFEEITGYSTEEAVGKNPRILKSGEMPEGYYTDLWDTLLNGNVWEEVVINRRKDGELYHARQTIAPVNTEEGDLEGFVAIQTDITDQIERHRKLETLIDNLPGIVYRCRNERGYPMEYVRGNVSELVGYTADELEQGAVSWGNDIIHPDDRDRVWTEVQKAVDEGIPFRIVYRITTNDDSEKWVWEQGQEVDPVSNGPLVLEGFIMDITEQKRFETGLRESIQHLQVIDRVLRHNFRNDMNIITGYADSIAAVTNGEIAKQATVVKDTGNQLIRTIDKEREITELLSEPTDPTAFDLIPRIHNVVEGIRSRHPQAEITFEGPDSARVTAIDKIDRVIEELVTNAIIHSSQEPPTVGITIRRENEEVIVSFRDGGPVLPEAELKILTDQADIEPLSHGSGLGLWLVNLIVRESGGWITYRTNDPRGNVIRIHLTGVSE